MQGITSYRNMELPQAISRDGFKNLSLYRIQCVSITNCLSKYLPIIIIIGKHIGPFAFPIKNIVHINDRPSAISLSKFLCLSLLMTQMF